MHPLTFASQLKRGLKSSLHILSRKAEGLALWSLGNPSGVLVRKKVPTPVFANSKSADKSEIKFDYYRISTWYCKLILTTGWAFFVPVPSMIVPVYPSTAQSISFLVWCAGPVIVLCMNSKYSDKTLRYLKLENDVQRFYPAVDCGF